MLALTWLRSLLVRRPGRILATAAGIAVAVALLASLAAFLSSSKATMTDRAISRVAVDWQVETQAGTDGATVLAAVQQQPGVRDALLVSFADVPGFSATTAGAAGTTTQTTGAGVLVGLPANYRSTFPGELRNLAGARSGVLVAQQTAANLQVALGDQVTVSLPGGATTVLRVDAIVDPTEADTLFQQVGAPVGAQATAPPDNVVFLDQAAFDRALGPVSTSTPDLVRRQVHVRLDHSLPSDPSAAYARTLVEANNLEVKLAGGALVGNNIGAALGSARSDALYAQILFLFLGLPGAALAAYLTATIAAAGRDRRRREQALLRTRGATTRQLVRLSSQEALVTGAIGAAVGLIGALVVGRIAFGRATFGATTGSAIGWSAGAATAGVLTALGTVAIPAWLDVRGRTVASSRRSDVRAPRPRWMRWKLDVILLVLGGVAFWSTSRNGYKLVLAPEGVPSISVNYWAFTGPALVWSGFALATWRAADFVLGAGRPIVGRVLRPLGAELAPTVAASLSRQRRTIARAVVIVSLSLAFAASTATFNATYHQQAEVDAKLSNGADVTVTESPGVAIGPAGAAPLEAIPGVRSVEPVQHRYAYVGADLQDLYGLRPSTIVGATDLQDAYFSGGTAKELMTKLASRPDGILVSLETVRDFQLRPGDALKLRLQDGKTKQYREVGFHYIGVAKEFPTAPKDSFLLANADYVARATASDAVGAFLVNTGGTNVNQVATAAQAVAGPGAQVTDIASSRRVIGSSLTSVDLAGLTKVELGFAVLLAAAATGLTLALGLAERRRTFAIVSALGGGRRQLGAFVWAEALVMAVPGLILGALGGWAVSNMLMKVLTGVFDPPPSHLAIPWGYLTLVVAIAIGALLVAGAWTLRTARSAIPGRLRGA